MITIDSSKPVVTLIHVHVCQPANQQTLVNLLVEGASAIHRHAVGFISASIHKSADGTRVTNYVQYRSWEELEDVWSNPSHAAFVTEVGALIESFDAHVYDDIEIIAPIKVEQTWNRLIKS